MTLRAASRSGLGYPQRASNPFAVNDGHERALVPLLVLLFVGTVGGTFACVLILICLAFEAVKNRPDRLFVGGIAGGDVEELLGGS